MILLRHGQTIFNLHFSKDRIDPGVADPPLTELGRAQALAAARSLKGRPVGRIVASPYTRALETAEIVADDLGLAVEIDPDIRELAGYSCDIGSEPDILKQRWRTWDFSELQPRWWAHHEGDPAAGGLDEPETRLIERIERFRSRMAGRQDWSETLVVCHWGPIRALIGRRVENGCFARHDPTQPRGLELSL